LTRNGLLLIRPPVIKLPTEATIVECTKVIWINGERNTVHGIEIHDETGKTIYSNSTIKFKTSTSFTFDTEGVYTCFDPKSANDSSTIEVITKEKTINSYSTNLTIPSVGLFVAPKADKQFWDVRLNRLANEGPCIPKLLCYRIKIKSKTHSISIIFVQR
jgi:hypothetical protein